MHGRRFCMRWIIRGWPGPSADGLGPRLAPNSTLCVCNLLFNIPLYATHTDYDSGSVHDGGCLEAVFPGPVRPCLTYWGPPHAKKENKNIKRGKRKRTQKTPAPVRARRRIPMRPQSPPSARPAFPPPPPRRPSPRCWVEVVLLAAPPFAASTLGGEISAPSRPCGPPSSSCRHWPGRSGGPCSPPEPLPTKRAAGIECTFIYSVCVCYQLFISRYMQPERLWKRAFRSCHPPQGCRRLLTQGDRQQNHKSGEQVGASPAARGAPVGGLRGPGLASAHSRW